VASVLALFFLWVAVTVPFPDADEPFVETSDRIWTEAIVLPVAGCLGYAASGLVRYARGQSVRWALIAPAFLLGALATPVVWLYLIGTYSGG
jgi:hypothetical protein